MISGRRGRVPRRSSPRERGAVLVLVVLFVFGVFAVAASTIDVAMAYLAQDQLQTATDAAALEALRFRDALGDPLARDHAIALAGLAFDDDLDPDPSAPDPGNFGAGPVIELVGGLGETNAGATIQIPEASSYKPNAEGTPLQPNLANAPHGDVVSGRYLPEQAHVEASDYARPDFDPSAPAHDAFLVRMRRTRDPLGLDRVPGVSSAGPTLPLLFGLGAPVHGADPGVFEPRTDGITIRATSIAAARRALRVTPAPAELLGLPYAPLLVDQAVWNAALVGEELHLGAADFAGEAEPSFDQDTVASTVGEPVTAGPPTTLVAGDHLVPVVGDLGGGARVIVGFGVATLAEPTAPPTDIVLVKGAARVVPSGADARCPEALSALASNPALRAAHAAIQDAAMVAVLVR